MKRRKGGLLQRMMAVLLSAVLVVGMVSNAAPAIVFAQEDGKTAGKTDNPELGEPVQEETGSEEQETDKPDGSEDIDSEEPEDTEDNTPEDPEDKEDSTPEEPEDKEDGTPEDGTEEETPEPDTEEETEPETVSENTIAEEGNGNLQALLARIAALPDAEEYLAAEPDMDSGEADEAAYEQWLVELYAHAEEALAIQEEIEKLTEEQRAQISEEELQKLAAWAEIAQTAGESAQVMAAETHKHPVCGASCGHSDAAHPDVEWTPLTQDNITTNTGNDYRGDYYKLDSGNYFLTEDISIDRILRCSDEVNLCFNGHTITSSLKGTGTSDSSLQAYKFNTCDCGSGGGFISAGEYLLTGTGHAMLNLYGGNFVGKNTVCLYTDTLTLDGATLEATGAAVDIQSLGKAFIKSGSATSSGNATVYIYTTNLNNFIMSGGTVTNTKSSGKALCFSYDKAGTITGGTITATGSSGKGVSIDAGGLVTLSGSPAISGGGGDISVGGNSKITANNLTAQSKYSISYAYTHSNITEGTSAAFTVDAPNDYSAYFAASDALKKSGLALRKTGGSGNEQTVEIYRPHKIAHCAEVPATCTADGTGEYWKCTNNGCGKMFSDADGNTEITSIPVNGALGHNKEGSVAHKNATCTEAGIQGGIYCTRCDDGKAEAETAIPATGHAYSWSITKEPTMTAGGTAAGVCGNDSSHKETKTLPVLTDTTVWTVGVKVEPTEDKDGSQTYTSEYGTVTVTIPSYAKIAAAAKTVVETALEGITATNATTAEEILSVINEALSNAGIAGVTVRIDKLIKYNASTSAAGHIEGVVFIDYCGQTVGSVNMEKPIAQLTAGKYTVAVNNGAGGGEYAAGDTVTIKADTPASGQQFDKWVVNYGNVTLADAASSTTTFTMRAEAVSVTATYKTNTGGGSTGGGSTGGGSTGGGSTGGGSTGGGSTGGGSTGGGSTGGGNTGGGSIGGGSSTGGGNSDSGNNNNDTDGGSNNNGDSGRGASGETGAAASKTPDASGTGQPRVKQEKEGNIQKEVRVEGESTLDVVVATTLPALSEMVLTKEEKEKAAGGTQISIVLDMKVASAVVSAADRALVEEAVRGPAAGYTIGQYLDVSLYKVIGDSRTAITQTPGKITVRIDVPEGLRNTDSSRARTFAVIRVHDGKAQVLADLDQDPDTITIETDRFSTYAVVYKDTAAGAGNPGSGEGGSIQLRAESGGGKESGNGKDDEPKTGDNTPLELSATLAMIAGFAYLLLYFTDRQRGMTQERKKELVSRLVGWAKRGGKIRKYLALAAIFVLLVYYHSIGKRTCAEWKAIYGE